MPSQKRTPSAAVSKAMRPSETINTRLRFQRSTSVPAIGPNTMVGNRLAVVARASVCAEPVVSVNHQIRANCTSALPTREKACPVQIAKNRASHLDESI
jgi:hypothetical protein